MDHETIRVITESIVGVGLIFIIGGVVFYLYQARNNKAK